MSVILKLITFSVVALVLNSCGISGINFDLAKECFETEKDAQECIADLRTEDEEIVTGGTKLTGSVTMIVGVSSAPNNNFRLPLKDEADLNYDFTVDYGDGSPALEVKSANDPNATYAYPTSGTYTITMTGRIEGFELERSALNPKTDAEKISSPGSAGTLCRVRNIIMTGDTGLHSTGLAEGFAYCSDLNVVDISGADTSKVTSFEKLFSNNGGLNQMNADGIDVSKVTNFSGAFQYLYSLNIIDLSTWDTSAAEDMSYMFHYSRNVTTLNLTGLETTNVTTMEGMFSRVDSLTTINVSSFDTSSVVNMSEMFSFAMDLQTLDLSNFDVSNVITMQDIFRGNNNSGSNQIDTIDLTGWRVRDEVYDPARNGFLPSGLRQDAYSFWNGRINNAGFNGATTDVICDDMNGYRPGEILGGFECSP